MAALRCTGRVGGCRFKTGVGDIQLDQAGPLELKAGAGDITVGQVIGDAEVSTAGAVGIGSVDGAAVVKNSNGDTWIGDVTGDVRVKAANGRITIDRARAAATLKTANGDLRLGEVERGAVLAESANGRIDVGIRDGVAAWLDLKTAFGNVQNDLQASDRPTRTRRRSTCAPGPPTATSPSAAAIRTTPGGMRHDHHDISITRSRPPGCASPSATRSCSTASTWTSPKARSSPCSARTAPARPPPCRSCPP